MRIKLTKFAKIYFGLLFGGFGMIGIGSLFPSLDLALLIAGLGTSMVFLAQVYLAATFILNAIKTVAPDKPKQEPDQDH